MPLSVGTLLEMASTLPIPKFRSKTSKKVLHSGERKIVFQVHQFFEKEFEAGSKFRKDAFVAKTSAVTGMCPASVRNIIMKAPDFTTPQKCV